MISENRLRIKQVHITNYEILDHLIKSLINMNSTKENG